MTNLAKLWERQKIDASIPGFGSTLEPQQRKRAFAFSKSPVHCGRGGRIRTDDLRVMSPCLSYRDVSSRPPLKPKPQLNPDFLIGSHFLSRDVLSNTPPDFPPIPKKRGFRFPPRRVCVITSKIAVPGATSTNTPGGRRGESCFQDYPISRPRMVGGPASSTQPTPDHRCKGE